MGKGPLQPTPCGYIRLNLNTASPDEPSSGTPCVNEMHVPMSSTGWALFPSLALPIPSEAALLLVSPTAASHSSSSVRSWLHQCLPWQPSASKRPLCDCFSRFLWRCFLHPARGCGGGPHLEVVHGSHHSRSLVVARMEQKHAPMISNPLAQQS